jgi:sortase A
MLSHVRRPSVALVVVAVLAVAGACSSPAPRAAPEHPSPVLVAPPALPATPPTTSGYADPTQAPPGPRLPEPVAIPRDPYAPERVVELGTIEIPAIGLTHRLFEGVTLNNIDRGPSLWTGSALPGQMGNTVVAGHRVTESQPFRRIDELVAGDTVIFTVGGTRSTYRVTGHLVVTPADSWIADQTTGYTATLYACHPLGSTAERYVVRLEMVR